MDAFGEHVGREDQRFALPDGEHGAIVADPFEPVVGQGGEEFFYVVYESEFGHGSRVCPAAAPRLPVRVCGFFTCGHRPGRWPRFGMGSKPVRTAAGAWAAFEIII